ncbi:MAG: hypothetical protein WBC60_01695 [Cognaticolwellia sp.]
MLKIISIAMLSILITSCASTTAVLNTNTPLHIYGVSSSSPNNGNWSVITSSGYQVALKTNLNESDSGVINMSIYEIPAFASDKEFLAHVVKGRASAPDIGRFKLKENSEKLIPLNGAVCVKHRTISQDNNAKIKDNESAVMLVEYIGYNCIHPHKKSVALHTEYSIRHFSHSKYPAFNEHADEFFSNIKFSAF